MRCFIVSPLVIGETILGSMRVESKNPSLFLLDDSRLLRSVCDLGALVLERAHFFKKAEESAIRDSLTSLFLRNYFFRRLKEEVKRAAMAKTSLGLIMLDIDDFKKINDSYGHTVGDLVIKKLAQILLDTAGNTANLICRFGGEEFMVCLVDCNRDRLHDTAEKIRSLAAETVVNFRRKEIRFTVSLGGVLYPDDSQDVLDLAGISDQLLYKAKKEGKNKACYLG
jgi:diguanylate cyclase (GGDEF)-like protein